MALTITDLTSTATPDDFTTKILANATALGLTTTAWQPGGVTRTIIASVAQVLGVVAGTAQTSVGNFVDGLVTTIAKGGFLDYASAVTPDPSVKQADGTYGAGGWLDLLAKSGYNVTRNPAAQGTSTVTLTNATAGTYGPLAAGQYHIKDTVSGATFSNAASITISPGANAGLLFSSDLSGPAGSGTPNAVVTSLNGVTVTSATTAVGTLAQSNASLVAACRAKLASIAAKTGATSAYSYFATATTETGYPVLSTPGYITRAAVVADKIAGTVAVYLATSSGAPSAPDATLIQTYLQSVCTPDDTTMTCSPCTTTAVSAAITYYGPTGLTASIQQAYVDYINSLPIGGTTTEDPGVIGVSRTEGEDFIAREVTTARIVSITSLGGGGKVSYPLTQNPPAVATATTGIVTVTYGGL